MLGREKNPVFEIGRVKNLDCLHRSHGTAVDRQGVGESSGRSENVYQDALRMHTIGVRMHYGME